MSSALAQSTITLDEFEAPPLVSLTGAQSILTPLRAKPIYWPQGIAVALYAAVLAVAVLNKMHSAPPVPEEAIELVMLPPPAPVAEEPPPPVEEPPPPVAEDPPPVPDEPPPPPVAEEAVAPVEPKPAPKPPQPKPKVVEHKPVEKPRPPSPAPARVAVSPPANSVPSGYFNQVESRVAHAAQSHPVKGPGRVGYRIVIAPSGSVISATISSSGRPDLDAAAKRAVAGPFPAFGGLRAVAVSGGIRYQ